MPYTAEFIAREPARTEIDSWPGQVLIEFGAPWCGHCQLAQAPLRQVLAARPEVRHLKIEDGSRLPLGRSFRVKLWPTLVLLRDGHEVGRVVRPTGVDEIDQVFSS